MKVLHLTDLHITEEQATLETLWLGPQQVLSDHHFDAIIVSGDLTQRASSREYTELLQFTDKYLLPLLSEKKRERGRIIFVPGNHDVDWGVQVGTREYPWPWRGTLQADWKKHRQSPATSLLRTYFKGPSTVHLLRVDPDSPEYRRRYQNCQKFLGEFYDAPSRSPVKPFKLTEVGEDWSVHQLVDEQIAIFGFNSCHANDCYWTAARIDHRSIANAATWWKKHFPNYQAVAVWHHGLTAEQGRPDFLTFHDLARLQEAGFRIGFHGHIHAANSWMLTQLRDNFVLIATGSLGAGKDDLQKGTGQQFSIVELYRSRVTVDVYERKGLGAQYVHNRDASHRFYLGSAPGKPALKRAERHVRVWSVDPNGILTGTVELINPEVESSLILAQLQPPFCNFEYQSADADGQPLTVDVEPQADGRQRLVLTDPKGTCSKLTWSYTVSNAVALNQNELKLREPVQRWYPNVPQDCDVRFHLVRLDTDELLLRLEFQEVVREEGVAEVPQPAIEEAFAIVEEKGGDGEWLLAREEQRRCKVTLVEDCGNRCAELRVTAPVVGMRYGIRFRPKEKGPVSPSSQARHLADNLLHQCRKLLPQYRKQMPPAELRQRLTDIIRINVTTEWLGSASAPPLLGHDEMWIGYIWDEEIRRLLATFGEFTPESWASRFAAGAGIAGHAFRQSGTAFWWKNKGRARLLFEKQVEPNQRPALLHPTEAQSAPRLRYDWLVCVPLYFSRHGRSIGVVSFAGKEETGAPIAKRLENLAYRSVHHIPKKREEVTKAEWEQHVQEKKELLQLRGQLETAINTGFWEIIRSAGELESADRSVAEHFFKSIRKE